MGDAKKKILKVYTTDDAVLQKVGLHNTFKTLALSHNSTAADMREAMLRAMKKGMTDAQCRDIEGECSTYCFVYIEEESILTFEDDNHPLEITESSQGGTFFFQPVSYDSQQHVTAVAAKDKKKSLFHIRRKGKDGSQNQSAKKLQKRTSQMAVEKKSKGAVGVSAAIERNLVTGDKVKAGGRARAKKLDLTEVGAKLQDSLQELESYKSAAVARFSGLKSDRNRVVLELFTSEITYLENLHRLCIYAWKAAEEVYNSGERRLIFNDLLPIHVLHSGIVHKLAPRYRDWDPDKTQIGEVFCDYLVSFSCYIRYCGQHELITKFLQSGMKSKIIATWMEKLTMELGQPLESYLILPVQRIPRYRMLLSDIIKQTKKEAPKHSDLPNLSRALKEIERIGVEVNQGIKSAEHSRATEKFKHRVKAMETILKEGKTFVMGGTLSISSSSGSAYNTIILFDDCLLLVESDKKHKESQASVRIALDELWVDEMENKEPTLVLRTPTEIYTLTASSGLEKQTWQNNLLSLSMSCIEEMGALRYLQVMYSTGTTFRMTGMYAGQWNARVPEQEGGGLVISPNQQRLYVGQFAKGSMEGSGIMVYPSASMVYLGDWSLGFPSGTGVMIRCSASKTFSDLIRSVQILITKGSGEIMPFVDTALENVRQWKAVMAEAGVSRELGFSNVQVCGHEVPHVVDYYYGGWKIGKRSGTGYQVTDLRSGHEVTYAGEWANDYRNGQGILRIEGRGVYEGQFVMDSREGHGTIRYVGSKRTYSGMWQHDVPHGQGDLVFPNGDEYSGDFALGEPSGKGELKAASGLWKYTGEWKQGQMSGKGTITTTCGYKYIGCLEHNLFHGRGVLLYPDGSVYEGNFEQGAKSGRGRLSSLDGWSYEGEWKSNLRHGKGKLVVIGQSLDFGGGKLAESKGSSAPAVCSTRNVRSDLPECEDVVVEAESPKMLTGKRKNRRSRPSSSMFTTRRSLKDGRSSRSGSGRTVDDLALVSPRKGGWLPDSESPTSGVKLGRPPGVMPSSSELLPGSGASSVQLSPGVWSGRVSPSSQAISSSRVGGGKFGSRSSRSGSRSSSPTSGAAPSSEGTSGETADSRTPPTDAPTAEAPDRSAEDLLSTPEKDTVAGSSLENAAAPTTTDGSAASPALSALKVPPSKPSVAPPSKPSRRPPPSPSAGRARQAGSFRPRQPGAATKGAPGSLAVVVQHVDGKQQQPVQSTPSPSVPSKPSSARPTGSPMPSRPGSLETAKQEQAPSNTSSPTIPTLVKSDPKICKLTTVADSKLMKGLLQISSPTLLSNGGKKIQNQLLPWDFPCLSKMDSEESYEYDGQWRMDMKWGSGELKTPSCTYVGKFEADKFHGHGRLTFYPGTQSEDTWEGVFVRGQRSGGGIRQTRLENIELQGTWTADRLHGTVTVQYPGLSQLHFDEAWRDDRCISDPVVSNQTASSGGTHSTVPLSFFLNTPHFF